VVVVVVEYLLSCGSTTGNYHHDTFSAQENYGTQDDLKGGASDEEAEGLDDGVNVCLGVEELNKCLPNSEDEENPPDEAAGVDEEEGGPENGGVAVGCCEFVGPPATTADPDNPWEELFEEKLAVGGWSGADLKGMTCGEAEGEW